MIGYTPINEHKLSKTSKEFLNECRKMRRFPVKNIHVPKDIFSDLVESMCINAREHCSNAIPFEDKILVRK